MLQETELQEILRKYQDRISYGTYIDWNPMESHNPGKKVVSASIIKCFILYYVLKNRTSFTEQIPVSEFSLTEDTVLRFFGGNTINLEAALALMIFVSDNTAANYFLDSIGMDRINRFLMDEKFNMTRFGRRFLDFEAKKNGMENVTSVSDLVSLFHGILEGNRLDENSAKLFDSLLKMQFDRTKLVFYYPETISTGSKTGVLDNVWNDVIYFSEKGKTCFVAFFTENVPDVDARDLLASYGFRVANRYFPGLI